MPEGASQPGERRTSPPTPYPGPWVSMARTSTTSRHSSHRAGCKASQRGRALPGDCSLGSSPGPACPGNMTWEGGSLLGHHDLLCNSGTTALALPPSSNTRSCSEGWLSSEGPCPTGAASSTGWPREDGHAALARTVLRPSPL